MSKNSKSETQQSNQNLPLILIIAHINAEAAKVLLQLWSTTVPLFSSVK
jgi:hypothetical protein